MGFLDSIRKVLKAAAQSTSSEQPPDLQCPPEESKPLSPLVVETTRNHLSEKIMSEDAEIGLREDFDDSGVDDDLDLEKELAYLADSMDDEENIEIAAEFKESEPSNNQQTGETVQTEAHEEVVESEMIAENGLEGIIGDVPAEDHEVDESAPAVIEDSLAREDEDTHAMEELGLSLEHTHQKVVHIPERRYEGDGEDSTTEERHVLAQYSPRPAEKESGVEAEERHVSTVAEGEVHLPASGKEADEEDLKGSESIPPSEVADHLTSGSGQKTATHVEASAVVVAVSRTDSKKIVEEDSDSEGEETRHKRKRFKSERVIEEPESEPKPAGRPTDEATTGKLLPLSSPRAPLRRQNIPAPHAGPGGSSSSSNSNSNRQDRSRGPPPPPSGGSFHRKPPMNVQMPPLAGLVSQNLPGRNRNVPLLSSPNYGRMNEVFQRARNAGLPLNTPLMGLSGNRSPALTRFQNAAAAITMNLGSLQQMGMQGSSYLLNPPLNSRMTPQLNPQLGVHQQPLSASGYPITRPELQGQMNPQMNMHMTGYPSLNPQPNFPGGVVRGQARGPRNMY